MLAAILPATAQAQSRTFRPIAVQQKVALVIGNASYSRAPLPNPIHDAQAVAAELRALGFNVVLTGNNLSLREFSRQIDEFAGRVRSGDLALFYFSGHGLQVDRENYLLPVDFEAAADADVPYTAYPASRVRDKLESSGARLRILILDACRDNPYKSSRGGPSGLAPMGTNAEGTLIAFATGDNNTASDGPGQTNGLFTGHLLTALREPGLELHDLFKRVKEDVYYGSNKRQNPFTYDDVAGSFYFRPPIDTGVGATRPSTVPAADADAWEAIRGSNEPKLFEQFLKEYPASQYAGAARLKVAALKPPESAKPPDTTLHSIDPRPNPALSSRALAGAGSVSSIYTAWFAEYGKGNGRTQPGYQAVGSAFGIAQLTDGTVDFAATDIPLTDDQLSAFQAKRGSSVLHIPVAVTAEVPIYNLPKFNVIVQFTPEVLAGIFMGRIKKWNDLEIARSHRGLLIFPNQDIVVVHRSDGGAATQMWTDYLSKASPEWRSKIGAASSVNWPVGLGGKGNEGVAGLVKQSPYSIGYVDYAYASQNHLSFGNVKNAAGTFLLAEPSQMSASAAGAAKNMPADFRVSFTNGPGERAYPISGFTWVLVPEHIADPARKVAVVDLIKWMLSDGQKLADSSGYARLPNEIQAKALAAVAKIR